MFVIINKGGIKIHLDVNVKSELIKLVVIKNLFGILVIVIVKNIEKNIENCKCRKNLVEECSGNIDENAIPSNDYGEVCNSCTIYIVLLVIFVIINISISSAFIYFYWSLKKH